MKLIVKKYKILSSTNDKAISLIKNNKFKPTIILSDSQKKGEEDMEKNGYHLLEIFL